MFTGIIETIGKIEAIHSIGSNLQFTISSPISKELKVDQSVAHNGVCLTVTDVLSGCHKVTAVEETLSKTNLGSLQKGCDLNMERCLQVGDRLDGHMVQGHVDTTGKCIEMQTLNGSWLYRFQFDKKFGALIIEKGSICVNGISLTSFQVKEDEFTVTIIPYTFEHTNINSVTKGSVVNLEFDILGKYMLRHLELNKPAI